MEPVFGFMKAILGFTRMSVRGLNKVKRELGFVLMALNIRKVVAQRAENNQKFIKRQFLYYFNRNCLFHLSRTLCPGLVYLMMMLTVFFFHDTKQFFTMIIVRSFSLYCDMLNILMIEFMFYTFK